MGRIAGVDPTLGPGPLLTEAVGLTGNILVAEFVTVGVALLLIVTDGDGVTDTCGVGVKVGELVTAGVGE